MPPLKQNNHGRALGGANRFSFSRDFISNQTLIGQDAAVLNWFHDDYAFDVVEGLGRATVSAARDPFYLVPGPGADLRLVANLELPVLTGGHVGLVARLSGDSGVNQSYYFGRIVGQNIRVSKIVNAGAVTTVITDSAFAWVVGEHLRLTFTLVGTAIRLLAENVTQSTSTEISGSDSDIASGDMCGFRSAFSDAAVWWRDISVTQI